MSKLNTTITRGGAALQGAIWALVWCFPFAMTCGALYRFPVPFSGYQSGWQALLQAPLAALFYLVLGGFVGVAGLGALAGVAAHKKAFGQKIRTLPLLRSWSAAVAALFVVGLAVLDKIIGPW